MIPMPKSSRIHFVLATGICALLLGSAGAAWSQEAKPAIIPSASAKAASSNNDKEKDAPPAILPDTLPIAAGSNSSQEAAPEKARALLEQVKKSEQDRQVAVKQTEIDRLKEDQSKIERDADGLKKSIESTSGLTTDATDKLSTLTLESRRLEHELAVAQARINAEKLKIEGLKALAEAQGKSQSALARRGEEAAARSSLRAIELELLQAGKQIPGEGHEGESQSELTKARKALTVAELKAQAEERLAHDAMKAAAAKMAQAESSATTAQRLADNDLTLDPAAAVAAKAKPKAKTSAETKPASDKPAPAAVATGPAKSASAGSTGAGNTTAITEAPPKPTTTATGTTTKKAAAASATAPARR